MAALSTQDLLRVWEAGQPQGSVGRALTILAAAFPGTPREELSRLPLGVRDSRLLEVRQATFGDALDGRASCARCGEQIEFPLRASDFGGGSAPEEGELVVDGATLRFRVPTSEDLLDALSCPSRDEARRRIAERCAPGAALSEDGLTKLAAAMAERDPHAETLLDYDCPVCGNRGQTLLDVAGFLWEEIRSRAIRLLRDVDVLARAYGWREEDILSLSPVRRRAYLELAGG